MGDSGLITLNLGTDRLQGSSQPCVTNQEEVNLEGVVIRDFGYFPYAIDTN